MAKLGIRGGLKNPYPDGCAGSSPARAIHVGGMMPKLIDLTTRRFGRLIVIQRVFDNRYEKPVWLCKCDCGKEKIIYGNSLRMGATQSCGCLQIEIVTHSNTKHGHSKNKKRSKIYSTWSDMIQRCTNPKDTGFHNYGGRGITVCKRWMKFENFLKDMGEPPTNKHQLDRIDNDKNYCKTNCCWSTRKQQQRNKRNNHIVVHNGQTQCVASWAEEYTIKHGTLRTRLARGWSIKRALTTPIKSRRKS